MACCIKVSSVCALPQVGQAALGACRAVSAPSYVLADVVAELRLSCGDVRVVRVVVPAPKAVAEGGCVAAGGQEDCWGLENGVSDAESALLDGGLGAQQASWVMGTRMIPPQQILREVCTLSGAEMEAVRRHRASMAPSEAEAKDVSQMHTQQWKRTFTQVHREHDLMARALQSLRILTISASLLDHTWRSAI